MLIPVFYIVVIPFQLNHRIGVSACEGLKVVVRDSSDYHFVTSREIKRLVNNGKAKYAGVPLKDVPLGEIESMIAEIPELRITEAYHTVDGFLHIDVDQRNPVVRLSTISGVEYYIDEEKYIIRKRGLNPPRVHIAHAGFDIKAGEQLGYMIGEDFESKALNDLYELVQYIRGDQLLSALVDQIEIDRRGEINLITRTTGHKVIFGDISDKEMKFRTLEEFYKQVPEEAGWNRYKSISLKFSGQVVCKRR
jgi:cell division protein FtsQ